MVADILSVANGLTHGFCIIRIVFFDQYHIICRNGQHICFFAFGSFNGLNPEVLIFDQFKYNFSYRPGIAKIFVS